MSRETARKIETSPNLEHVNVRRDSTGSVSMTTHTTTTGKTATGTTTTTVFTTTMRDPNMIGFTMAKISGSGGGGGNTATVNLIRDGSTILSTSGTGAVTTTHTTTQTHTTPLNAPQFKLQLKANGGTATASLDTLSHENKWA